jgi:hypothetical protein
MIAKMIAKTMLADCKNKDCKNNDCKTMIADCQNDCKQ